MDIPLESHIDIDTRPCPTVGVGSYKTASGDPFNAPVSGLFVSVIAPKTGSQTGTTTSNADRILPSFAVASFQTTYSSASTPSVPSTIAEKAIPKATIAAGEIFAIVLSSLIAIVLPIVLLVRCLKRLGQRKRERETKKDTMILRDVMRSRDISEDAWEVGLGRLEEASNRKLTHKDTAMQWTDHLGQPESDTRTMREQCNMERGVFKSLFEEENRVRGVGRDKKLPAVPKDKVIAA
ncbi:hypothetical protein TUN199_02227 [Pyrenophora tritici-repentis]|uniref:Uncharacterized protein n=1 Tax=Pyrenophora tritici-repentis TaxID=45151 RepID=A0A2W1GN39_9PLEO|nr:hypothetical protein PtrM4_137770 [Pyrenophora tritici-repentis]KAI0588480.1 hypothetical protein Alg215_00918 [Pyrenophora tritici-repentis]KAI0591866.1 hypothetical protein Alg130_00885 [Pyrenophora tritici-repentis]KAI0625742.1 hypothetical protein TUN199_02227 [Pyrenophora tritici-repentis]KAI1515595.1 hypothetical protein Ptr86124_005596 [Pyrenophora tritici-repentis]